MALSDETNEIQQGYRLLGVLKFHTMYTRCVFALIESKVILMWFVNVTQWLSKKTVGYDLSMLLK